MNKRRRDLILSMGPDELYTINDLLKINIEIAMEYKDLSSRTINRDIKELIDLELMSVNNENQFYANYDLLKKFIPKRVKQK